MLLSVRCHWPLQLVHSRCNTQRHVASCTLGIPTGTARRLMQLSLSCSRLGSSQQHVLCSQRFPSAFKEYHVMHARRLSNMVGTFHSTRLWIETGAGSTNVRCNTRSDPTISTSTKQRYPPICWMTANTQLDVSVLCCSLSTGKWSSDMLVLPIYPSHLHCNEWTDRRRSECRDAPQYLHDDAQTSGPCRICNM